MEASEPKLVNSILDIIWVNLLMLAGIKAMMYHIIPWYPFECVLIKLSLNFNLFSILKLGYS